MSIDQVMPKLKVVHYPFTLLEVTIASVLVAVLTLACLDFMDKSTRINIMSITKTDMERRLQFAIDEVVATLRETSTRKLSYLDFQAGPGNNWQTALVFPTARDINGDYIFTSDSGTIMSTPVWQGIVIYAFYAPVAGEPGRLMKYVDYTPGRNYDNMISIAGITATTITLNDNLNTTFPRATPSTLGNQIITIVSDDIAQFVHEGPDAPAPLVFETDASGNPLPDAKLVTSLILKVVAQKEISELGGEDIQVMSTTGVLSRNQN